MQQLQYSQSLRRIPSYVQGFCSTTIQIPVVANVLSYVLNNRVNLGLPRDAVVVGIQNRTSALAGDNKDIKNRPIVRAATTAGKTYINLLDVKSQYILKDIPMREISKDNSSITFIEPRFAQEIDWAGSRIEVLDPAILVAGEVFELTFFYYRYKQNATDYMGQVENRQFNGINQLGLRRTKLDVRTYAGQQSYSLARQSFVSVPKDAILVGIDFNSSNGTYTRGGLNPVTTTTTQATFLQLKEQGFSILDNIPISMLTAADQLQISPKYIPIKPTKIADIDFDSSSLYIADPALPVDNAALQAILYYIFKL